MSLQAQKKPPSEIKETNGPIQNRRIRNRWNKEQKLAILEYIRKLMQLNPGQSRHEAAKLASKELSISFSTIQNWINNEPEILAIRDGRFNKRRQNFQEDEGSLEKVIEHRGYLRLPPRKLADKQIITKEIFNKVGFISVYHTLIFNNFGSDAQYSLPSAIYPNGKDEIFHLQRCLCLFGLFGRL